MPRKILISKIREFFSFLRREPWYKRILLTPLPLRVTIGIIFMLIGVTGLIFPAIPGIPFILAGVSLHIGVGRMEGFVLRIVQKLRLHIFFGKFYTWWHKK